jgi:ACS family D-galactonate transporter-like MFS transporter
MNGAADPVKVGPSWVRWRILALLMALSYVSWFLRVGMSVAYDERIKEALGITPEAMGWVYSAFLLAYMLCMTPGGWLIDRWGTRAALTVMGFGLVLFGALTGLVGASPALLARLPGGVILAGRTLAMPLVLFLVVRSLMGIFATPMYPAAAHSVACWLPFRRRGWANGLVQGSALLGIASTPLVVGTLIVWFDWPQTFLILAVGTGLLTIVWALYATDRPGQHPGVNPEERDLIAADCGPAVGEEGGGQRRWVVLLRNRSLVCLTLAYAAVGYFEYLFYFWMDYYFKDQLHLPDDVRRLYAGIPFLAMAGGMACGGLASDFFVRVYGYRKGRAIVPVAGMVIGAAFLLLGIVVKQPEGIVACFSVALAAVGGVEAPTWATAVELGGRRGGLAAGICNTGGNAGGLVAPVLTPLIAGRFGWAPAIAVGSAVCLVGMLLWKWIDPSERVPED